ncbi:uncharacterized protein LOC124927153 isoform X2 [Impatiens glandulifera]|uniref:uncharacterized protein LOC124927153 isoform X2 n=1 Tax=Impatiens glandulifera TaxID=253017 RepID=UPI001FB091E1|nr:uncharacterized protein LOC124927153 isoform X2 [Impatiens glandulifera]
MAFLFRKFQEAVKALAKNRSISRDPRHLQFEADINRLFLYTSYNRLGRDASEADIDEIIDMTKKAPFTDQQKQVQENIHSQVNAFCTRMDDILLPDHKGKNAPLDSQTNTAPIRSGLSLAVGRHPSIAPGHRPTVADTKPLKREELSKRLKDLVGYNVVIKPSEIPHKEAGLGLFVDGEADVGDVIAFYPGLVYSPAYYRYIPGYPRVNANNSYLITRYDGNVINAQPWGVGGESRELWDWSTSSFPVSKDNNDMKGSDRIWKMLSKPLDPTRTTGAGDILELRNPLAFAHFANHPGKDMSPNVMVCSYDFPLSEVKMRPYIPNVAFGGGREEVKMKKYGTFWFKSWGGGGSDAPPPPSLKSIVLVATRKLCGEEVLLNYRLSNSKLRPSWYTPVDEEEDRRRWS